jgi:hypothetical protein
MSDDSFERSKWYPEPENPDGLDRMVLDAKIACIVNGLTFKETNHFISKEVKDRLAKDLEQSFKDAFEHFNGYQQSDSYWDEYFKNMS